MNSFIFINKLKPKLKIILQIQKVSLVCVLLYKCGDLNLSKR